MAVDKPVAVKQATIASRDVVSFNGGLDERGAYNAAINTFVKGRNGWANSAGNFTKRLAKRKWLPRAEAFNSDLSTVYFDNQVYYFIADDGEIKYIQDNDTSWTSCGGTNTITTTPGVITTFVRTNDVLLALNGVDPMMYVDLATMDVVTFNAVIDPTNAPTAAATGITGSGSYNVFYGVTWNSNGGGETATSPVLTQAVSKSRSTWKTDGTEYLTITRNNTAPANATSWNLYAAVAIAGTTPQPSDLVMLKANIPLATTTFVDNGSQPFDIAYNVAPDENSTEGIKAKFGLVVGDIPVVYGDPDNPYTIYFGGSVDTGVSFGSNNGAQRLPLLIGSNYYPTSVVGFRNNQGVPGLFALFTSVDGVSRQMTISKKTISYGDNILNYWDGDEMNTGATAVYSPYGVVNHLGRLLFTSSEGIVSINTEAQMQNTLSTSIVNDKIQDTYSTIKNAMFEKIVATAWSNYVFFLVPSRGYNYNNQILVYDLTDKDNPKWAIWDLGGDWIGTISPPNRDSFVYMRDGRDFYQLYEAYAAEDEDENGVASPYPVSISGPLIPFSSGRNSYYAVAQAVFYVAEWVGEITIEVMYKNAKGRSKYKTKTFVNGEYQRLSKSGWGNPRLVYNSYNNQVIGWSTPMPYSQDSSSGKIVKRLVVRLPNPLTNEVQFTVSSSANNSSFDLVGANIEGVSVGVLGDIV